MVIIDVCQISSYFLENYVIFSILDFLIFFQNKYDVVHVQNKYDGILHEKVRALCGIFILRSIFRSSTATPIMIFVRCVYYSA